MMGLRGQFEASYAARELWGQEGNLERERSKVVDEMIAMFAEIVDENHTFTAAYHLQSRFDEINQKLQAVREQRENLERREAHQRKLLVELETLQYDRALLIEQMSDLINEHQVRYGDAPLPNRSFEMVKELSEIDARIENLNRIIELTKESGK
jgi:hypothetical protein